MTLKEALWRYVYRQSGISRLLFKSYVAPHFDLVSVKCDEQLDTSTFFFIILDGSVDIKVTVAGGSTQEFTLVSGEFIDIHF